MVLAHDINENRRTTDIQISQDITFDNMLLADTTLNGLKESGFLKPSPIQLHGIPLGKCGFDLLLEAKSGTGKTAVFSIISLEKIDLKKGLQVIILAPTREIASQICDVIRQIGCKYDGLHVEVVMGGLPVEDDIIKFKDNKIHIVVGSPGRLKHLIHSKYIETNSVRLLILDEADKLMETSFLVDIKYIHSSLPSQKQVILSSATYPKSSKEIINKFVHEAQHVCPNSDCVLLGVVQKVTYVKCHNNIVKQTEYRFKELLKILTRIQFKQCLIFCNYQTRVGELHKMLTKEKWPAEQLYGKQEQIDRLDALKTLQEYKCRLLISTDLAARGIDASNVDLVVNFEPPFEWQTYLHRIGRAGRYGSYGVAVTVLSTGSEKKKFFNMLEQYNLSVNLKPLWEDNEMSHESESIAEPNLPDTQVIEADQPIIPEYSLLTKISEDINYKYLWDFFCENNDLKNKMNNLESFDDLSKSFKELEIDDVSSFSDLLESFKNTNNNNNILENNNTSVCQYKNISLPDNLLKSYIIRLRDQKNDLQKQGIVQEDNKICHNLTDIDKHNCLNKHLHEKSVQNGSDIDRKFLLYNDMYGVSRQHNIELTDLGLPMAFESSKDKPKRRNKYENNGGFHNNKAVKSTKNFMNGKSVGSSENIVTKKKIEEFDRQSKRDYKRIEQKKTINSQNYSLNNSSSSSNSKVKIVNNIKYSINSYSNWYTQLKFHVKQIEMAIYIEELSKL